MFLRHDSVRAEIDALTRHEARLFYPAALAAHAASKGISPDPPFATRRSVEELEHARDAVRDT